MTKAKLLEWATAQRDRALELQDNAQGQYAQQFAQQADAYRAVIAVCDEVSRLKSEVEMLSVRKATQDGER